MNGWVPRIASFLPDYIRLRLLSSYWASYWQKEYRKERVTLGVEDLPPIIGSERAVLIEQISNLYPFTSVLEVGSGHGQNFDILARLFPKVTFVGVDSNEERVNSSNQLFQHQNLSQVTFVQGEAGQLPEFLDRSADIVVSSAMMLFVAPDRVEQVVREMLRIARRAVFVLEQHQVDLNNPSQYLGVRCLKDTGISDYYLRDYFALFARFVPESAIHLIEVPNPRWPIEQWKQYAKVFRIDLK